jgi:isobutyryl-CoA mutase
VHEVVDAVIEEDAQGVAVSSYQGGHVEYFEYLSQRLKEAGAGHVKIFGGGGGVIVSAEIERLAAAGVRIFSGSGPYFVTVTIRQRKGRDADVRPPVRR